jgi:hypothetical protein
MTAGVPPDRTEEEVSALLAPLGGESAPAIRAVLAGWRIAA